ncbi:MAG: hypothetical protein RLZZ432_579 [Chloroflexota bacterium]
MKRFAVAFGALFVAIGTVYYVLSGDIGGVAMLYALGVAMTTMTLIIIHAMDTAA